jgi:hypothetical protein
MHDKRHCATGQFYHGRTFSEQVGPQQEPEILKRDGDQYRIHIFETGKEKMQMRKQR